MRGIDSTSDVRGFIRWDPPSDVSALTEDELKGLAAVGTLRFGTLCAGRIHARVAAFLFVHGNTVTVHTCLHAYVSTHALARTYVPSQPTAVGFRMES
jgi:hypothetical protein